MERHFGYWQERLDEGTAIVYGPVADPAGSWGLAVVRAHNEEDVRGLGVRRPGGQLGDGHLRGLLDAGRHSSASPNPNTSSGS